MLPTGKYSALATREQLDRTAANIDKLWSLRLKGAEVDLGANASTQVRLTPTAVF